MRVWVLSFCSIKFHTHAQKSWKWIEFSQGCTHAHASSCLIRVEQANVHVWPVGSKAIYSEMGLWMRIVFISLVLDKNWNLKSVTCCHRCHKQESAGCLDACNEKSRIFAHPIKTSHVSNWIGKLASSSMLFNVGLDFSVKPSSSSLHFSIGSRMKMGAHWWDCDMQKYSAQMSQPHQNVPLFQIWIVSSDTALWGLLDTWGLDQTTVKVYVLITAGSFIEIGHFNIERSNILNNVVFPGHLAICKHFVYSWIKWN